MRRSIEEYDIVLIIYIWVHSWLGYYFWDKGIKDYEYVTLDLGVYYDLLLFEQ